MIAIQWRIAPCGCEYEIQAGVVLSFRDCGPHGGQTGDFEDLAFDRYDQLELAVGA